MAGVTGMLVLVVTATYIYMGNPLALVPWTVCLLLTSFLTRLIRRSTTTPLNLPRFGLLCYLSLSVVGLTLIAIYRSTYGVDFGPYGDDSRYFSNIRMIVDGYSGECGLRPTAYEYFMSGWCLVVSLLNADPGNLDLLPMNWLLGALAACLSYQLAYEVTGRICPVWLVFFTLIGNCVFSDSVANLYRDGLMLVAFLTSMVAALRGKYTLAVLAAFLCALVRSANGALALFFIALLMKDRIKLFRHNPILSTFALCTALLCVLLLDSLFGLGGRGRYIAGSREIGRSPSIVAVAVERSTWLTDSELDSDSTDLTKTIFRLGPLGYSLMPVVTVFTPVRTKDLYQDARVSRWEDDRLYVHHQYGIRPQAIFEWITVALWVIVGPYLVLGILEAANRNRARPGFLSFFVISLLALTFVSFQLRHRLALYVMYPAFVTLAYHASGQRRASLFLLRILFLGALAVVNIVAR